MGVLVLRVFYSKDVVANRCSRSKEAIVKKKFSHFLMSGYASTKQKRISLKPNMWIRR